MDGRLRTYVNTIACVLSLAGLAQADGDAPKGRSLNHVGTFSVPANLPADLEQSTITSAEIVDATPDGKTLVYTDSPSGRIGLIDIADANKPLPLGSIEVGGEPTSVAVLGDWALVLVNTSQDPDGEAGPLNDYDAPSGELVVIDIASRSEVRRITLAGQPDSIALSPDQNYAAIVIENERDEDENEGLIPQSPAGNLQVLEISAAVEDWTLETVELKGLAEIAPDDPEPELVDINQHNKAVVSLQENNHLVIVDLTTAKVLDHFSAGSVTLENVDATTEEIGPGEAGVISLSETITRRREPDAVHWIDEDTFATANEGDYEDADGVEGGSRGFTLFNIDGSVEYDSGNSFEYEVLRAGHYPEARSGAKGVEPEGLEVATLGGRKYLFVGAERANVVGVYDVTDGQPKFQQLLPTGIGPEGIRAIPSRDLLVVSAETDGLDDDFPVRSLVTIYKLEKGAAVYPQLVSEDVDGKPIPWLAISGLSADAESGEALWAVSDSYLAQAYLYRIDVSQKPARIVKRIAVGEADGALDLEGVATRATGGFWLASEGQLESEEEPEEEGGEGKIIPGRPNQLLRVAADGKILEHVELPEALRDQATNNGFEGVAVSGSEEAGDEAVWVAFQREWADDAEGFVKIGRYDVADAAWRFALYPLDKVESPSGGWVGLSELTRLPDGKLLVVERDNQIALDARIKRLYAITPSDVDFAAYGEALPVLEKTLARDVLEDLDAHSISVPDKLEGVGLTKDGRLYLATDNDGNDENYGETLFFSVPKP
jgi:DNA-binding beta-propeller fold protein YncE